MKIEATEFLPLARREALITKEVEGELLVYDVTRDKAHCLNETAAAVWRLCDGRTSVASIGERISGQWAVGSEQSDNGGRQPADGSALSTQHPALSTSQQIIWLALDQLRRSHLLEEATVAGEKTSWPFAIPGLANMSRREAVRRIGLGAAIALPIVVSITAPTAVEAAVSCKHHCQPCSSPVDCCGTCSTAVPGCSGPPMCT